MKYVLLGAALAAAALVPTASASGTAAVKLALVPLPKPALGSAAHNLPLARDSGVVSNSEAASEATGNVTAKQLRRLGRVNGYLLDYGSPFGVGSSARFREVQTEIERYRSSAAARKGLAFWRRDEVKSPGLKSFGLHFSVRRLRLSHMPKPNWAYAGIVTLKGVEPLLAVDAELQQGRYLLDVSVAASSNSTAARIVPAIARRLLLRLQNALHGRLHASPVKLPQPLKPGAPPHGPKPAGLVLRTADVGAPAKVLHKGYSRPKGSLDPTALSVYDLTMTSGGTFPYVTQEVLAGNGSLEVRYLAAILVSGIVAGRAGTKATPVDLGDVGDNARGALLKISSGGRTAYEAAVVLTRGAYLDFVLVASPSPLTSTDVHSLASLAAKRLNAQ